MYIGYARRHDRVGENQTNRPVIFRTLQKTKNQKRVSVEDSATESAKKKQHRLSLTQTPTKAQTQTQVQTTPAAVFESEIERETVAVEEPCDFHTKCMRKAMIIGALVCVTTPDYRYGKRTS